MKNTNQNSGSKSAFKPIIATSLALALGVSVASAAATQSAINADTTIGTAGASGPVAIGTNAYTDTATNKTAGLFITGNTSGITLTFLQDATMDAIDGGSDKDAYSIYNSAGNATLTSDTFKTITVTANPTTTKSEGEKYIFKNAGSVVTFKNVAIYAGSSASGSNYGITSDLASAKFAFGTATNLVGADGGKNQQASDFTGMILSQTTTIGGTLNVTAGNGASVANSSTGVVTGSTDGKAGGSATGISLKSGATVLTIENSLALTVTGGNGGTGGKNGSNGAGGNAIGISVDSGVNAKATVSGGNITLNLVAGKNGADANAQANPNATLTAISNTGSNELAFTNQVLVGSASTTATTQAALRSSLAGVKYDFGNSNGSNASAKTTFTITSAKADANAGSNVLGADILADAEFAGVVEFSATGGAAATSSNANGGDATGLSITTGALSFKDKANNSLKITAVGGAKDGSGTDGVAKGITVASGASFDGSNLTALSITSGATNTSSATGIELAGTGSSFNANAITLEVDSSADATGIKLGSGSNFSAGTITLGSGSTGIGKTNAVTATALDLNGATFAGSFTADSAHVVGNSTNTTSATLIKNAGVSTIANGTITLTTDGLAAKVSSDGTTAIIANTGTLNFGVLADATKEIEASNASLVIGAPTLTGNLPNVKFFGLANQLANTKLDFGSGTNQVIFNVTGANIQIASGAVLENSTTISGKGVFNVVTTGTTGAANGLISKANQTILGNLVFNVAGGEGNTVGAYFDATSPQTLTLQKAPAAGTTSPAANTIELNVDSDKDAKGIIIKGGELTIQDNTSPSPVNLGLDRFALQIGTQTATTATALVLDASGSLAGETIDISGSNIQIGNTTTTTKAVAISVEGGSISDQNIFVGNILQAKDGGNKYVLDVVSTSAAIEFDGHDIIANADNTTPTGIFGLYSGLSKVGYNFGSVGSAEGVKFTVTGTAGANDAGKGSGSSATGAIIADDAFFQGKTIFTVTGGAGENDGSSPAAAAEGVGGNGGSAIGIDIRAGKSLALISDTKGNDSLKLVVDGGIGYSGTGVTQAVNGNAVGIQVANGGTFDASLASLALSVGATNAVNATALDLNGATFAGSFTLDGTTDVDTSKKAIVNASNTATLIKNTGTSTIANSVITLVDADGTTADNGFDGLTGKTATILNNTGALTFNNSSLVVGKGVLNAGSYGFVNNEQNTINIDFGSSANASTTFTLLGEGASDVDKANAFGMVLLNKASTEATTNIAGNVTFNVTGGSYANGIQLAGSGVGLLVNAGGSTHALVGSDASLTLKVDGGTGGDADGDAVGLYVTNGTFSLEGLALNFQIGTKSAENAYAFYMDDDTASGSFSTSLIDLSNSQYAQIGNTTDTTKATAVYIAKGSTQSGFQLNIADGVLKAKTTEGKKYVLEVESGRASAITFTRNAGQSQSITAGTASADAGVYGIYSGIADVSYNFGNIETTLAAGTIFNVTAASGNATGAIIAANATFEGAAALNVTASAKDATAVGIRLDGTSDFNASFDYGESVIIASSGTAIALQTTGTHTITGDVLISDPNTTLVGQTKYIFQNTGTSTTFDGKMTVGADATGTYGLYNNFDGANYAFGTLTTFNTTGADNTDATGAYFHNSANTTGTNFSGNVVFNVTGGDKKSGTKTGNGTGLLNDTATTLILAPNSTMTFNVDSGAGVSGEATGIKVTKQALTFTDGSKDESKQYIPTGTQGFVFNVGATNATKVTAIDLAYDSSAGSIVGDLVIGAGSKIGNTAKATDVAVVRLSDANSTLANQSIIVEKDVTLQSKSNGVYILKNGKTDSAITFANNGTSKHTISVGEVATTAGVYGLYSNIADVSYDFGKTSASDAGTIFSVENTGATGGDATGAIIAQNVTFENLARFAVTAKDGSTAVGIRLDNSSNFAGDFDFKGSTIKAGETTGTGTAIALQTTGTHTIAGNIGIATDGNSILTAKTTYIFKNTGTSTTFDGSLKVGSGSGSGIDGLYSNLASRYDFGTKTVFNVNGGQFTENGQTNVANTKEAVGFNLANAGAQIGGAVVFNVTGGSHTDTSISLSNQTVKSATGLLSNAEQTLTLDTGHSVTFNVDTGLAQITSSTDNKATGMEIATGALTLKTAKSSETSNFVFNIGTKNAQVVTGIDLQSGGSIDGSIVIGANSTLGNTDYTSDLAVIRVDSGATIANQNIVVQDNVKLLAKEGVNKYILQNSGNVAIDFGTSTITAGSGAPTKEAYGLYSGMEGVSYNFGTNRASFTVTGNSTTKKDASGIILSADTRFEGIANFTVTGGKVASGTGGNAYGIKATNGELTLTLAENAALNFTVMGGAGVTQGQASGISAENGTLKIVKEGNRSGSINFTIGDALNQVQSAGVDLNNGTFDGSVSFAGVKASQNAYGIKNANESIIKSGTISFGKEAFKDVPTWSVIENTGSLTIARGANVVAGEMGVPFNGSSTSGTMTTIYSNTAGIYNNIENATYNLGNLKLEIEENKGNNYIVDISGGAPVTTVIGKSQAYGIYSEDVANTFNVAAGSSVDISAVDAKNTKAFGGSVNLALASGEKTNVYLNTDGGYIASLNAGDNAYIYLSGANKASRVGHAANLDFRTLEVGVMGSAPTAASKAVANTTSKGANFVVLADATRGNGTSYNADGTLNTSGKGSAYTRDGKLSTTGGSDRIVVDYDITNMPSVSAVDSTLHVGLSSLNTTGDDKYVVLAQVANGYTNITSQNGGNARLQDLVTFNGLKNNGDSVEVQTQVGFDSAKITITRHDLGTAEQTGEFAGVGAVYVSNLITNDVTIDSDMADASVSAISTNYDLVSANLNSLSKRMGELRNTDNAQGVWGRVFAGQQTSNFGAEQKTTYLTFQAGYDYNVSLDSGVNYTGLALSYVHSSSTQSNASFLIDNVGTRVEGNANSLSDGVEVAVYNSYISDMGLYSDSIVKFGYFVSDLNIPTQDTYTSKNFSFALSEEIGYRVKLGAQDEWFIDPQVELAYAYVNGSDFTQVLGSSSMKTAQDAISLLRSRVGAAWGYKFDHLGKDKGVKASLYLGTYYAYDMISGGQVNLETNNGTTENYDLKSNGRFVLNVGTDVAVQDTTKFYVDFEKSFGSTMQTDYQVSVGVRYSFGAKTPSAKKEEKKESAPLKVGE